jgi:hypothetical protein
LSRQLGRLDSRIATLRHDLDDAERERDQLQARLELLERLAGPSQHLRVVPSENAPATSSETHMRLLRGAAIREFAVHVLLSSGTPLRPLHYQRWYELLRAEGFAAGGKDPLATFLTQLSRSPVVKRASRSGEYVIDFDAPQRLRAQVSDLRRKLSAVADGDSRSADAVAADSKRRAELTRAVARAERNLEEALRLLNGTTPTNASVRRRA